jgi:hypothetical protein
LQGCIRSAGFNPLARCVSLVEANADMTYLCPW